MPVTISVSKDTLVTKRPNYLNLSPLNTDPHHLAIPYRLQFGNTDLNPRRLEVLDDDLRDMFGKRF